MTDDVHLRLDSIRREGHPLTVGINPALPNDLMASELARAVQSLHNAGRNAHVSGNILLGNKEAFEIGDSVCTINTPGALANLVMNTNGRVDCHRDGQTDSANIRLLPYHTKHQWSGSR